MCVCGVLTNHSSHPFKTQVRVGPEGGEGRLLLLRLSSSACWARSPTIRFQEIPVHIDIPGESSSTTDTGALRPVELCGHLAPTFLSYSQEFYCELLLTLW